MSWYGEVALNGNVDMHFTTRRFSTGTPFTLAGSPLVSAYPNNSLVQLTAGLTLSVNFDGMVGLNHVRVVATGANGYVEGAVYALVLTAGTVDGVSVAGEVVGSFRIQTPVTPLDAAETRAALGLASANLDAQLSTLSAFVDTEIAVILAAVDTEVASIKAKTDQLAFTVANRVDASVPTLPDPDVAAIRAKTDQLTFTQALKVDAALLAAADLATAVGQKVADIVLRRVAAQIEVSLHGDSPLSSASLYGLLMRAEQSSTVDHPGFLRIYQTNGTSIVGDVPLTADAEAQGITAFG